MISPECTFESAACLTSRLILLLTRIDYFKEKGESFCRFAYFDRDDISDPWGYKDFPAEHFVSISLWRKHIRTALTEEGRVRLHSRLENKEIFLQIPDAGVFRQGARGYGYVNRIRAIGEGLYVCGAHRQVYRYECDRQAPLKGRFVDMAGPMRQPPLGPAPSGSDAAFEAWAAQDIMMFNDIAGSSEQDIYATGDETAHFDGQRWQMIELPVERETMYVVEVLDADRVFIGGSNGYLFAGNARAGFRNISHVDDNHDITGLQWFDGRLFVATAKGLFTHDPQSRRLLRVNTGLHPELQDAHLLQAMDGVLWSFGYKDLAYWDSASGNAQWVRVHHPDNPRIGSTQAQPAASTAALRRSAGAAAAGTTAALPPWLPAPSAPAAPRPDLSVLLPLIGHLGAGAALLEQLSPLGLLPEQVLQIHRKQRYTIELPGLGMELLVQYCGRLKSEEQARARPQDWGLAEVTLNAHDKHPWPGPWPGDLQAHGSDVLQQARRTWGAEATRSASAASFHVDGARGAQWVVAISFTAGGALSSLKIMHLGGYLA